MKLTHYSKRSEQNLRLQIAQEAARLIIEDGILDYQFAKLKAAHHFDMSDTVSGLPGNEDIDHAMLQYHQIYSGEQQQQWLTRQRQVALEAMEFLELFSPRLTGSVLTGVAGQHSPVILQIFAETPETVIITLLDADIPFAERTHQVMSPQGSPESYSRLVFQVDEIAVELCLLPLKYLRNQSKTKGLLAKRATVQQVRNLLGLQKTKNKESFQSA